MDKTCNQCKITKPRTLEFFYKKLNSLSSLCKDCRDSNNRQYRIDNAANLKEKRSKYYLDNIESHKKRYSERYTLKKRETCEKNNQYAVKRYHSDSVYRFSFIIAAQLRNVLYKDAKYTEKSRMYDITGLTGTELFNYLWGTFEYNYGIPRGWVDRSQVQIDHIIPKSQGKTEDEVRKLNHYTNLQLLLKEDNQSKRAKYHKGELNE